MFDLLSVLSQEMLLFAACGMVLFGIDDLLVDCLWLWGKSRQPQPLLLDGSDQTTAKIAVFVPAWREDGVVGLMLERCLKVWANQPFHIFVGTYQNDPATRAAAQALQSPKIKLVTLAQDGPTTKADCLNGLWAALASFEADHHTHFDAILLHDAEDHAHGGEISLFSAFCGDYDLIQIPVVPVVDQNSRWIAGHYLDEFAEAHRKEMQVRQSIGASVPSAGTGCAISRRALDQIASQKGGLPFDKSCLTEDYELGLHLWQEGFASRFIRAIDPATQTEIIVRSCFPATIDAAVRQKTRWIIGIALAGWDRTGWHGQWIEHWMRWRDRRVILAATLIFSGYVGSILWLILAASGAPTPLSASLTTLLGWTGFFLIWRLLFRAYFTTAEYGWREGVRSIPRLAIANIISVMAATRAVMGYVRLTLTDKVVWDKTAHSFPSAQDAQNREAQRK